MLGAQARAAELQAAKSAAMRQKAHTETEDVAIPPELVPVSLTDFVRNPLLNKNKGIKAFRPLTDSDFEVPRKQKDQRTAIPGSPSTESVRQIVLETAPVAPRAMLARSEPYVSRLTPSSIRDSMFLPQTMIPNISIKHPDGIDGPFPTSPYTDGTQNTTACVFGPDDLSPAKQEIKFNIMRQNNESTIKAQLPAQSFSNAPAFDGGEHTPHHGCPYRAHLQNLNTSTQTTYDPRMRGFVGMETYQSEAEASATGFDPTQSYAERTYIFAEDVMDHETHLEQYSGHQESIKPVTAIVDYDQPYDRHSKMQSFVAAQQAMARKGKTVLHNPDLHRPPHHLDGFTYPSVANPQPEISHLDNSASTSVSMVPNMSTLTGSMHSTEIQAREMVPRDVPRLDVFASGIFMPLNTSNGDDHNEIEQFRSHEREDWRSLFNNMAFEEWYVLRPVTAKEQQEMLYVSRSRSVPSLKDTVHPLSADSISLIGEPAREWLLHDHGYNTSRHVAAIEAVEKHERAKDQSSSYGIIGRPLSKEKFDSSFKGSLKAVASIMATIYDCSDDFKSHPELSQYTPVSNHAIHRHGEVNASLFDDLGFETPGKDTSLKF